MKLEFEWDELKAKTNQRKHGVSFEEAKTIFQDQFSITINDPLHSLDEDRFVDIGISTQLRLLVVVYTQRGSQIRLISCRKVSLQEEKIYAQSKY